MKKILLVCLVALLVVSCDDSNNDIRMRVINLSANASDWVPQKDNDGLNLFYYVRFAMPEINSSVMNNGNVSVYSVGNGSQVVLPYVSHFQNTAGNFWTQTVDFNFLAGGMNIFFTNSDFAAIPPSNMNFRVVITW